MIDSFNNEVYLICISDIMWGGVGLRPVTDFEFYLSRCTDRDLYIQEMKIYNDKDLYMVNHYLRRQKTFFLL